jgi:hypothetical protein
MIGTFRRWSATADYSIGFKLSNEPARRLY